MRLERIRWFRYRIPFRRAFRTAHGTERFREGLLLELCMDDGHVGLGECAPLPGRGGALETIMAALPQTLNRYLNQTAGHHLAILPNLARDNGAGLSPLDVKPTDFPAPLQAALDTALLDLTGQATGRSMAALLADAPAASVPVNATVGDADTGAAVERSRAAVVSGFRTVKLKVGISARLGSEVERVAAVRAAIGPNIQLRLDANEAWTVAQAVAIIKALAPFDIEYVEQPVAADDIEGMAAVRRRVETPIAADEAVTGEEAVRRLLTAAADILIFKPTLLGGPRRCAALLALTNSLGGRAVITSALECGIGVAAACHIAATLAAPIFACGLATSDLLTADLLTEPLQIANGDLAVPVGPGLGMQVDWRQVARFVVAEGEGRARW